MNVVGLLLHHLVLAASVAFDFNVGMWLPHHLTNRIIKQTDLLAAEEQKAEHADELVSPSNGARQLAIALVTARLCLHPRTSCGRWSH